MQNINLNNILQKSSKPSIFYFYTVLAKKYNALNFGQGFPNFGIPTILEEGIKTQIKKSNEYDNTQIRYTFGTEKLLRTISEEYSQFIKQNLKWNENIIVGSGATQILMFLMQTLKQNEEVIILEPYFPWYVVQSSLQEVKIQYVRYKQQNDPYQLDIDWKEVQSKCNDNTKFIIINSPHNPSGKIMNEKDFENLHQICLKYPKLNIISDEVYEMVYFVGKQFPRVSNYKDLWNKVISVYSGGKTFSCTGWRLGWAIGSEPLISKLKNIQKLTCGDTNGMLMDSMAEAIIEGRKNYQDCENYYSYLKKIYDNKKNKLVEGLEKSQLDFQIIQPEGGYFVLCNIEKSIQKMPISFFFEFDSKEFQDNENNYLKNFDEWRNLKNVTYMPDEAFANFLTKNYKITPIPCNDFYNQDTTNNKQDDSIYKYLRFAICKHDQDIQDLNDNFVKYSSKK